MNRAFAALACLASAPTAAQDGALRFDPVLADHAVLQRDRILPVQGTAAPSARVTISLAGKTVETVADAAGKWRASLPALPAGGPYRLTATDGAGVTAALEDIMLGDVFLCGGQSNMSYLTKFATDASNVLKTPADPAIRFATVPLTQPALATRALARSLEWRIAAPETLGEASAVCYFMALELKKEKGVTIGFVRSSLGGTRVESWLSADALRRLPPYGERVAALQAFARSPADGRAAWQRHVASWWRTALPDARAASPDFDDSRWDWARLSGQRQPTTATMPDHFGGAIWYRHAAMLDAAAARDITSLDLGTIAEDATVWVNGRLIGAREGGENAPYPVPGGVLRAGRNVVAVRLLDHGSAWNTRVCRAGCAWGSAGGPRPLAPDWRYHVAARLPDLPLAPRAPWAGGRGLGTLYNGMIAPIAPSSFKGVIWYQGESNVADPADYRRLLPVLLQDWRRTFADPDLPFVMVQLTAFGPVAKRPGRSDWAELREVQRGVSLADPRTALVVSIDAGDRWDIHPAQKKIVGQRVARAMRRLAYGDAVSVGGPRPIGVNRDGNDLMIAFGDTDGGLVTLSSDRAIGFETCDAARACVFADAKVEGDRVRLIGGNRGAPTYVRYAWANTPVVNLYDRSNIPAIPFELAVR